MKRRGWACCATLGAWLATVERAPAHRLDEYLQATRLAVSPERVDLEIDLTAGSALAPEIFGWMDTNRDGAISAAEGEAYAREVLRSVVLKIDGSPVEIRLLENSFPELREMNEGMGTVRLRASARVAATGAGQHQLAYMNTHRAEKSVYLVNALVPEDKRVQLGEQRRDRAQLGMTLDYRVAGDSMPVRSMMVLTAAAMAGLFWLRRGRRA